ncbi:MAG: hypothetical protein WCV82_03960 [Candidatus Paceibacterota bacterium]
MYSRASSVISGARLAVELAETAFNIWAGTANPETAATVMGKFNDYKMPILDALNTAQGAVQMAQELGTQPDISKAMARAGELYVSVTKLIDEVRQSRKSFGEDEFSKVPKTLSR